VLEGRHEIALDDKGRLLMPARFKRSLLAACEGQLTVTMDHSFPCLRGYARGHWENEVKPKLYQLSEFEPEQFRVRWMMIGNANPVDMDKQGRVLVPQDLRAEINLDGKAMIIGQGSYFELWTVEAYAQRRDQVRQSNLAGNPSPALANLSLQ